MIGSITWLVDMIECLAQVSSNHLSRQRSNTFRRVGKQHNHTGKCIRRFGGINAYCRYFIDRKW